MSGLDGLSREELVDLVLKLHETVVTQQAEIAELKATVARQSERISELEEEVARLRGSRPGVDFSIKPSVPKKEKQPRKQRKQSFCRGNLTPTQVVYHSVEQCPECGRELSGGHAKWRRQVVDLPPVSVDVVDHVFVERLCGVCGKRHTPDPNVALAGVVVGKKSFGIRLMSVIAHLKTVCRVPVGQIRKLVWTLWGLKISAGEICEICHDVAELGEATYDDVLKEVRGSPVVCADETGWREDGINGYIWSFSTPFVRYYTYRYSRGSVVARETLSEEFHGALVSDFYAAYNFYDGVKQRCWVHLNRDLDTLVEKNQDLPDVQVWVDAVKSLYHRAKDCSNRPCSELQRSRYKLGFERELVELCNAYVGDKSAPERVLAQRMTNYISELFAFVANPEIPSENNAAERAIRPAVVARKISGGSRSARGSKTCSILRTLFETWNLHDHNTIDACRLMIANART